MGQTRYKDVSDLADTDEILLKGDGTPIVMRSSPGRRSTPNIGPENATIAEVLKKKDSHLATDPLLQMTRHDPESPNVLQEVMVGISEEVASINFERKEAERRGKDTGTLSQRRIQGLRALAETWLKRKEQITSREIDLDSKPFDAVFQFIMETFRDAMGAAKMRPEAIETVFAKFALMIDDDWKNEARVRQKKAF